MKTKPRRHIRLKEWACNHNKTLQPKEEYLEFTNGSLVDQEYKLRTNSEGFILPKKIKERPVLENTKKIFFFGDSFVEQVYSDEEKRIFSVVQDEVAKEQDIICLNGGYSGATSLNLFNSILNKIQPNSNSIIFFVVPSNDVLALKYNRGYWCYGDQRYTPVLPVAEIKEKFNDSLNLDHLLGVVKSIKEYCDNFSMPFLLATFPYVNRDYENQPWYQKRYGARRSYSDLIAQRKSVNELIRTLSASKNIPLCDLEKAFSGSPTDFYDDLHLNHKGGDAVGRYVAGFMLDYFRNKGVKLDSSPLETLPVLKKQNITEVATTAHYDISAWKMDVYQHNSVASVVTDGISCNGIHRVTLSGKQMLDICANDLSLLNVDDRDKVILVGFSGAVGDRLGKKAPFFSGLKLAKALELPIVSISDPTLAIDSDIKLAWYLGNESIPDLPLQIANILDGMAKKHQARLLLFGGSGGGYASLLMSTLLTCEATALVWNPQTAIAEYAYTVVIKYLEVAFPGLGETLITLRAKGSEGRDLLRETLRTLPVLHDVCAEKVKIDSNILYLQNIADSHLTKHAAPYFLNKKWYRVGQTTFMEKKNDQIGVFFGRWGEGHVVPPRVILETSLKKLAEGETVLDVIQSLDSKEERIFQWFATSHGFRLEVVAYIKNGQVYATCTHAAQVDEMSEVIYAFYLLLDGERCAMRWYENNPTACFDLPRDAGKLEVIAFAKDGLENKVRVQIPVEQSFR